MTESEKENKPKRPSLGAEVGVYAATIAAALIAMGSHVRHSFYEMMRKKGLYDDIQGTKETLLTRVGDTAAMIKNYSKNPAKFKEEFHKINSTYSQAVNTANENIGVKHIGHKFTYLSKYKQARALGIALTITAVGIGGYINISHRRELRDRLDKVEQNQKDQSVAI